jgi:ABC-2 type transport system ATP-binding protein
MVPALAVRKLKKVYGPPTKPFTAVDEISFDLKAGEILGLLGPNGCGKTTTIQMLLGTLSYTSGSIHYFGKEFPLHRSEILQTVSFASTYTSLPYSLTLEENLHCFGLLYGLGRKESIKRSDPLLERFGILDKKKHKVSALSAGQVTRLMLVKAFYTEPRIVLLDEPTASLDPDMANEVCAFLLDQRNKAGISILFTSHKMNEVSQLCDRTIFLKKGTIIADDMPKNLAKKVSPFQIKLTVAGEMKRVVELAVSQKLSHHIEHRTICLSLKEKEIPPFLNALILSQIMYTSIQIEEPSLEDYFLHIAEKTR